MSKEIQAYAVVVVAADGGTGTLLRLRCLWLLWRRARPARASLCLSTTTELWQVEKVEAKARGESPTKTGPPRRAEVRDAIAMSCLQTWVGLVLAKKYVYNS